MKVVCIIQARMGSKRLPGKVLLPLNGHTVLEEVIGRCKRIPGVDEVVVATPDWAIARYCPREAFLGSEDDVLERYYQAAIATKAYVIVRITADCPLLSPELCGEVLAALKRSNADYSSNVMPRTFPKGFDCEAFTMATLNNAHDNSFGPEREHVTPWMQHDPSVKRVNVRSPWQMDGRLTLDTEDDYKTICAAFGHEPYAHRKAA